MSKAAWRFSQCCKIFPVSDSNVVSKHFFYFYVLVAWRDSSPQKQVNIFFPFNSIYIVLAAFFEMLFVEMSAISWI